MKKEAMLRKRLAKVNTPPDLILVGPSLLILLFVQYVVEIKRQKVDTVPFSAIDANVLVEKLWKYRRILTKPTQVQSD
jgi:hypothetical protein